MFNGLQYSTWEVNPPNPTGYAPTMMVTCMNDPGPITDPANPAGAKIQDPLYNPAYSQFCYEIPFMPGQTQYMDTPVVPTSAFADRYNLPDCAYPDATPAVARVDGDGIGPYVSAAGHTITITALGDQTVPNHGYVGPQATTAPFNQKTIKRHYGFGSNGPGTVTIGGVQAPLVGSWSDMSLTVTVPSTVPTCGEVQRGAGAGVRCGELVITASTADGGKSSVDAVTVTIGATGGKAPTYVTAENGANNAIQTALDKAAPGDLIIVGPPAGVTAPVTFYEMLLMWKPVRLQGVGAATVVVNANTHPSGKIDPWRRQAVCLFGLALDGGFISASHPYDPNGKYTCSTALQATVDPIPLEPLVGWDPTLNGNIAELLQEPTLLGAYEGAAITVLAKGVQNSPNTPTGARDPNCSANGICVPLTASTTDCAYTSNFLCQPSRIDGLSFTNSSQGGGGIFVHGWNHFLDVANNRVYSNAGTLSGGITVGQPETTDATTNADGTAAAFGYYKNVNVHNNYVTENAAYGDELNSTTPMAAGGVTICTGADNYKFNHNWVCGNISTGDGGGFAHFGLSYNGNISNNWFVFNQSTNPTIPTNGGGVLISGAPPDGPACENATVDVDCPPSLSNGAGAGLVIDANLILGNTAESGSGGGLRLQSVNGTEVAPNAGNPGRWYDVTVTNNIIANNVAGWDGGGVSLVDALNVRFINNTVMSNDTTASAGVLFNTLGAPNANTPPPGCDPTIDPDCIHSQVLQSVPLPAGLVTMQNTPNMISSLGGLTLTCPNGLAGCKTFSNPLLRNNVFWQNRAFHIVDDGTGAGLLNQQHTVSLHPTLTQPTVDAIVAGVVTGGSGACVSGATYWDIGYRGDLNQTPGSSSSTPAANSGPKLSPQYSILTNAADYGPAGTTHNLGSNPLVVQQYCDGARVPPENGGLGYAVPPGISDATLPNPVFSLTPSATVDEGNNWINMSYGPLSLVNPSIQSGSVGYNAALGNYAITSGSPAQDAATATGAPPRDFFGTLRPQGSAVDIGAVEVVSSVVAPAVTLAAAPGSSAAFGNVTVTATAASAPTQDFRLSNAGPTTFTISGITVGAAPFTRVNGGVTGNCGATLLAGANCTIRVRFQPTAVGPFSGAVTVTGTGPGGIATTVTGSPLTVTGTGVASAITFTLQSGATAGVQLTFIGALPTLNFGTQTTNSTATGTLRLTNTGGTAVNFATPPPGNTVAGARYAKGADTCLGSLGAGASCTITVTFNPNSGAARVGTLTVRDNAAGAPQTVVLMGN